MIMYSFYFTQFFFNSQLKNATFKTHKSADANEQQKTV
jgi:hypothetical protein